MDAYRSRSVGFIFQAFHLLPTLRAIENVQVPMFETKLSGREREKKAASLLREVGLEHRMNQYPNLLSAGERQRAAIARSLANDPEILLADEPTGNLDSDNSGKIMALLEGIRHQRHMVLVVVTHEAAIAHLAERTIHLRDGSNWTG
jgi:putative ABC transport system ATP-binding protein